MERKDDIATLECLILTYNDMANLTKNIGVAFLAIALLIFVYLSLSKEMDSTQPEETTPTKEEW